MANPQDAEAVMRKMAFERIMDGDYTVLWPCSICLVLDQTLASIQPSLFREPEVGRPEHQPWGWTLGTEFQGFRC